MIYLTIIDLIIYFILSIQVWFRLLSPLNKILIEYSASILVHYILTLIFLSLFYLCFFTILKGFWSPFDYLNQHFIDCSAPLPCLRTQIRTGLACSTDCSGSDHSACFLRVFWLRLHLIL